MDKEKTNNSLHDEEDERITKTLSYAVKFSCGKIESQALIKSVLQQKERSA